MTPPSPFSIDSAGADDRRSIENPLRLVKLAVAALLLASTVTAILLAASGVEPRALRLVFVCWAVYGFGDAP
ncbi:MAG TPA: hypothetical protein VFU46_08560 [Gemmatimonadales bacterium]|nr:hypothetical protein [Gemmatimonadales bacterium]